MLRTHTVGEVASEIGKKVKEKFGESAEPLYERLITFILELYKRNLILLGGWDEQRD